MSTVKGLSPPVGQRFRAATPGSRQLWERACEIFPQGVSGQAKFFSPYPVFITSARGANVVDVEGRSYVDLLMGAGPMLLGHGHPHVIEAIHRQIENMTNPMMPNQLSLEYAERLRGRMPYLERIRFTSTGSEATRSAIRVARAATGRTKIAKFEGNYHGADDVFLVSTHSTQLKGPSERPEPVLDYAGLSDRLLDEVVVLPFNAARTAADLIAEQGSDLAAVIMEPVAFSSGGAIPATHEFAQAVRKACSDHGVALVFDEVLCAFRLGLGGAPSYLGITPDLATIGKAVGGGLPLAAFGGRADLMEAALGAKAGDRKIFQSGTFTENPVSIAAGLATLEILETEPALERADAAGEGLRAGLRRMLKESGTPGVVTGVGSIIQIHFGTRSVSDRRGVVAADVERTRAFMLGLITEGVLWPPVHPALTSAAHGDAEIDQALAGARAALADGS